MVSQVSDRGQITIDRSIRRQLGIEPGMVAVQRIVGGRLEVVFVPAPHRRSLFGILHRPNAPTPPYPTNSDELEEAVMEAVAEEQRGSSRH